MAHDYSEWSLESTRDNLPESSLIGKAALDHIISLRLPSGGYDPGQTIEVLLGAIIGLEQTVVEIQETVAKLVEAATPTQAQRAAKSRYDAQMINANSQN